MTNTSIKLNHFIIGIHKLLCHNLYDLSQYLPRKYRIFVNFLFLTLLDGHFKGQNFKTHFTGYVCIERRATLTFSVSFNLKKLGIRRSDNLKNEPILLLFCVFQLCPFIKNTA